MRRGRNFFRHGELHLVLLALLEDRPAHGYELLSALRERFGPAYSPSPGSIYPALTAMHEEGLIESDERDDRRVYALTDAGRDALARRIDEIFEIESRTGASIASPSGVDAIISRFVSRVRRASRALDPPAVEAVLEEGASCLEQLARTRRDRR